MSQSKGFMPFQAKAASTVVNEERTKFEAERSELRQVIAEKDKKITELEEQNQSQSDEIFELTDKIASLKQQLFLSEEKLQKMMKQMDLLKEKFEMEKLGFRQNENKLRKSFESRLRQSEESAEINAVVRESVSSQGFPVGQESSDLIPVLASLYAKIETLDVLVAGETTKS
ncbi:NodT family RND efflux system outer membrane lipoprotein [Perkinsela sp. CCAP 1560/4]|nr:NodT family RND efflux system outer membrane lipoprotein [Perkinsela sp. CCAP 1560/4]KNH08605.1 NodT family RND efflux system outer membrane lipoprotein [Perkinsela sp. CCAP 1560/4]|eukprot:KNH07597.1 NodT family RND efflux system outer membrane lipoprotein [Perkinsela sp. CCAP 1560/4]